MTTKNSKREAGYVAKPSAYRKKPLSARAEQLLAEDARATTVHDRAASPMGDHGGFEQISWTQGNGGMFWIVGGGVVVGGAVALAGGGSTQTVPVTNHAPTLSMGASTTTNVGQAVMVPFTASDPDGQQPTITTTQGVHGTVVVGATAVSYTPSAGFVGTDTFTTTASDTAGLTSSSTVTVVVKDTVVPVFATRDVAINVASGVAAGQALYTAHATDDTALTYSLQPGGDAALFTIDPHTGVVNQANGANFAERDSFTFTVMATDASNNTSVQNVVISVEGAVATTHYQIPFGVLGSPVIITDFDASDPNYTIEFVGVNDINAALPARFSLDPHSFIFGFGIEIHTPLATPNLVSAENALLMANGGMGLALGQVSYFAHWVSDLDPTLAGNQTGTMITRIADVNNNGNFDSGEITAVAYIVGLNPFAINDAMLVNFA